MHRNNGGLIGIDMRLPQKILAQWHSLSLTLKVAAFILLCAFLFANLGVIVLAASFGGLIVCFGAPYIHRLLSNQPNKVLAEKFVSRNIVFSYQNNYGNYSKIDLLVTRIWTPGDGALMISGFYHHKEITLRFRAERMTEVEDVDKNCVYETGLQWAAAVIDSDDV